LLGRSFAIRPNFLRRGRLGRTIRLPAAVAAGGNVHLNGGRWESTSPDVSVTFTDLTEGVADMRLANSQAELESTSWVPFTGLTTIELPNELGPHVVYVQLRDAAGNESRVGRGFAILVDANPPGSTAGPLGGWYFTDTISVPYVASDDQSGIAAVELWWRHRPDGGSPWSEWAIGPTATESPITFAFSEGPGFYELYTIAMDGAGNRENPPAAADAGTVFAEAGSLTERVSVSTAGLEANNNSDVSTISADGRYVAFVSWASNLVEGDTNARPDIFVHDRATGVTERVSVATGGTQANDRSFLGSISDDGRYIAFQSAATNLVPGDTNGANDVFVHDRLESTTVRVSVATAGTQANARSADVSISGDGLHVAFSSQASNLVADDTNGDWDVFVHDRASGVTERVSVASGGGQATGITYYTAISANGQVVAFASSAADLVADDTNGRWDVFVHDRSTGATTRASVASSGAEGNDTSDFPGLSADGRYVVFESYATTLVPNDSNSTWDIFIHDTTTGETTRVSVADDGGQATGDSMLPSVSDDGSRVAFVSWAGNVVPDDGNGSPDVFVRDIATGRTLRASLSAEDVEGNAGSSYPGISGDGKHAVFASVASNLGTLQLRSLARPAPVGPTRAGAVNRLELAPSRNSPPRLRTFGRVGAGCPVWVAGGPRLRPPKGRRSSNRQGTGLSADDPPPLRT
jgi:hypothetical protein